MKEIKESRCAVCGAEIEQPQRGRRRKYCSAKCRARYGNRKHAMKPELPAGLARCVQCGKEFERAAKSKRECCSKKCGQIWGRRSTIEEIRQLAFEEKQKSCPDEFRNWVLELHYNGYERKAITEALRLPKRRLKTWLEKYTKGVDGNWIRILGEKCVRRRKKPYGGQNRYEPHYDYPEAGTAAEWLSALRERTSLKHPCVKDPSLEGRSIFLVCGIIGIRKGADSLCTVIQYGLRMNPFGGDIFIFCGKDREQIKYMYWADSGFNVLQRNRGMGTYPWPSPTLGEIIPITSEDLEYVLHGERIATQHRGSIIQWDSITLSETL